MTPQEMIKKLDLMSKSVLKNKSDDIKTKYQVKLMFEYLKTLIRYQIPTPPTEVSEDGLLFKCPRCEQWFEGGSDIDTVDIFYFCPACGQRFKEGSPIEQERENEN